MYAIIDCNNFYASCERVFNPKLIGKPVVILSNNDGCIIARSNEAKALGVPMGEPFFKIRALAAEHHIEMFSSNYTLYGDMSARVMHIIKQHMADVEIYSIDEAFINLNHQPDGIEACKKLCQTIRQWTGIPVSIGIAPTKTLAKVANHKAKKNPSYKGVCVIDNHKHAIATALKNTAIGDIWGVGRRLGKKLPYYGINTAYDFITQPDSWIRKTLGVQGQRMAWELRGMPCYELEAQPNQKKSILVSRSFGKSITGIDNINEAMANFATRAAEKLRKENLLTTCIYVFLKTNRFDKRGRYTSCSQAIGLSQPSDYTATIINQALQATRQAYNPKLHYKKCGIMLLNLMDKGSFQPSLFTEESSLTFQNDSLMHAIDSLNLKMGKHTVSYATALGKGQWEAHKDHKSHSYTTNWNELLEV